MIGVNVNIDLLSLFPQKDARIMGGMGRKGKLFKVNNGGERNGRANLQMRKKGLYIAPAQNLTVTGTLTQKFRSWGQNFRPGGGISAPLIKFPAQISAPLTEACTTKDLAEFCRAGNYGISAGNSGLGGGISGPGEIINTKTAVTFASGLRFR
jgi:hypothetical protein